MLQARWADVAASPVGGRGAPLHWERTPHVGVELVEPVLAIGAGDHGGVGARAEEVATALGRELATRLFVDGRERASGKLPSSRAGLGPPRQWPAERGLGGVLLLRSSSEGASF